MSTGGWSGQGVVVVHYPSGRRIYVAVTSVAWGEVKGKFVVSGKHAGGDVLMEVDGATFKMHEGIAGDSVLVFDPRALITTRTGTVLYNGRNEKDDPHFPPDMRTWLDEHPEWPPPPEANQPPRLWKRGEPVRVQRGDESYDGVIEIASDNGCSVGVTLIQRVTVDQRVGIFTPALALLWNGSAFVDIFDDRPVEILPRAN